MARIAERVLMPEIQQATDLPEQQHSFRKGHSTVTAVSTLVEDVIDGFNEKRLPRRTIAVALDLKKAFDTVNLDQLIELILESRLTAHTKKWLSNYLRGRKQRTDLDGVLSKAAVIKTGVPQGSVLSPTLFAWYLQDIPQPKDEQVKLIIYADDITIYAQSTDRKDAGARINRYLDELSPYLKKKQLFVSTGKCASILFSTWSKEWKEPLGIKLSNADIPTVDSLKLLGVTLDHSLTFNEHIKGVNQKALKRTNAIKAICSRKHGLKRKEGTTIYKAMLKSTLNYGAATWAPNVSETNWKKLEARQNDGLRAVTGCLKMSPVDHIRTETMCIPIKENCNMIACQFAAEALQNPGHPCHMKTKKDSSARQVRK